MYMKLFLLESLLILYVIIQIAINELKGGE